MDKEFELKRLEELVDEAFHKLADKYNLDVDLVGEIIADYTDWVGKELEWHPIVSKN